MGKIKLQSFTIIFNKSVAVYTLGECVTGFCFISLKGEMNLNQLGIRLFGLAESGWSQLGFTSRSGVQRKGRVTYRGSHSYFSHNYFPFKGKCCMNCEKFIK